MCGLPNGQPLATASGIAISPRDQVLVSGPSGSGKSTLLRAIAGIWPFGTGTISIPKGAKVMVLPQRPYLPIGTLHAAIAYPALPKQFDAAQVREVVTAVGLPALAERLDEEAHWNRMLSLGEQQRLGLARALLHAPDYLFLDEATASLDEPSEAALYTLVESAAAERRDRLDRPSLDAWRHSTSGGWNWQRTATARSCAKRRWCPRIERAARSPTLHKKRRQPEGCRRMFATVGEDAVTSARRASCRTPAWRRSAHRTSSSSTPTGL